MTRFASYYYCLPNGRAPVREFIDSLSVSAYRRFVFKKELLEEFGPSLPMPHARHLGKGLYELRFRGREGNIRMLYFFTEKNKVVFVHAFKKTSRKTPKKDLVLAYGRMG